MASCGHGGACATGWTFLMQAVAIAVGGAFSPLPCTLDDAAGGSTSALMWC
jgi:hypothetical protein